MNVKLVAAILVALPFFATAGCGEQKVTVFKQGQYQGKPDTRPWDNPQFNGDKIAWEKAITERSLGQNEYTRTSPTAN
jgi:hypothetical protein